MRLQILHVPDCPGARAMDSILGPLLAARTYRQPAQEALTPAVPG